MERSPCGSTCLQQYVGPHLLLHRSSRWGLKGAVLEGGVFFDVHLHSFHIYTRGLRR